MAKRTAEQKAQLRANLRHPVVWLKGAGLPPEVVRPWELAAQIVPGVFGGLRGAIAGLQGWVHLNIFKFPPWPHQTVVNTVSTIWDSVNDPIVGAYMDYRNYSFAVHRWILRVATTAGHLLGLFYVFNMGLTHWQRAALYIAVNCINDLFGTPAGVSGTKFFAQITSNSAQRGRLITAGKLGAMISSNIGAAAWPLLGLRDILGIDVYPMFTIWMVVTLVPSLLASLAPTFVLQRVPDPKPPEGKLTFREILLEVKESFAIMRHNKFFVLSTAARFAATFTPNISEADFFRFGGINDTVEQVVQGWAGKGNAELLYAVRNFVVGAPGSLLQPFAMTMIKKVGGARNMLMVYSGMNAVAYALRYVVGVKTIPGILFEWGADMLRRMFQRWEQVAGDIVTYDMFDYVEWVTGRRSEGVSAAVGGLLNKFVINNLNTIVGNYALMKAGFDIELGTNQPESYKKWAAVFFFLSSAFDHGLNFIARWLYKYPDEQRRQVEADLIERRRLAQEAKEELREEATV